MVAKFTPTVGAQVFDRWWPWRVGRVQKTSKSTATVKWSDGTTWVYDRAHFQFLQRSDS